jgi:hypothetical protein
LERERESHGCESGKFRLLSPFNLNSNFGSIQKGTQGKEKEEGTNLFLNLSQKLQKLKLG